MFGIMCFYKKNIRFVINSDLKVKRINSTSWLYDNYLIRVHIKMHEVY